MPLTHCLYHQIENNHLLLLQGTEVYIDPDALTPLKLIEWALEQKIISNTEQLALLQIVNTLQKSVKPPEEYVLRISKLKSEKEKWSYSTYQDLSHPASRMHKHLLDFRNNSNADAQIAFDQIGLVFTPTNSGLSSQRTAVTKSPEVLQALVNWFEDHLNILVTFSQFPKEEIDQILRSDMEETPNQSSLKQNNNVLKPTSKKE